MITIGLFKLRKKLDKRGLNVVSLFHQTSDKKLLRMKGKETRCLIGSENWSAESSDSLSEGAGVRTESLLSRFFNLKIYR